MCVGGGARLPGARWGGRGMSVKVLVADDHKIVRDGLRSLLSREADIEVVGEAETGRQATEMARQLKPEVVIMDIAMREMNGIEATRQLKEESPSTHVIALSMHSDRRYVSEMLAAGATGYLLKDGAFEELATAIRRVSNGQMFLAQGVSGTVLNDYVSRLNGTGPGGAQGNGKPLSPRERQVLQLIAEGVSTKQIAADLHLSVKTVETHRRQMMDKLGIYNVAGLIKHAIREGIASLDE